MAEEQQPIISEQDMPPMSVHSSPQDTHVMPPPAATTAYSGALPTHLPPSAQTPSNAIDPMRFTTLEGMVNQLDANMNTNMTELMTMLRDQKQASSSYTPSPERRTTVHPNPVDPPIYVTDSEDVSFSAMTYVPAVYSVSDPLPPPLAPTSVPLPPAAFLSTDSAMLTLSPLTIPAQPPIYTVPPPTIPSVVFAQAPALTADHFSFQAPQPQMNFPFQAPPPLNIPPLNRAHLLMPLLQLHR
ncbi:WAS/WASL-interacting protein family member 3-like [Punica granatum]|uniref:WAS/WASL-interacting protein family member 3-like n=1 Tax=Punica granatum TaxID=22663 RepID=A0A6P8C481_PUNGR|nr:WAS/WASL-interacting protein family member 3-like [Punica granatum]